MTLALNLFVVKQNKTGKTISDWFPTKREAKTYRDEFNRDKVAWEQCHVSKGPDHHHYNPTGKAA